MADTLQRVKLFLRIKHDALDADIQSDIEAAKADLRVCGIIHADENDPLIFNAVKLYCASIYTDDLAKGAEYLRRYDALKACLQMAEGYGWKEETVNE